MFQSRAHIADVSRSLRRWMSTIRFEDTHGESMKQKITVEQVLSRLPKASPRNYVLNFVDHRGRKFIESLFVSTDWDAPGWFVWGRSKSGATKIVGRPRGPKARGRSGARVHRGWGTAARAHELAALLSLPETAPPARTTEREHIGCCTDLCFEGMNIDLGECDF